MAVLVALAGWALSIWLRWDAFNEQIGAQGLEATYHVLWTLQALGSAPPEAHLYLPTVTLTPDAAHPVPWGGTVPTRGGSQIYTSFPPLGFLIPFAALNAVGAPAAFLPLALFNSLLGLAAALGIGGLCGAVARGAMQHVTSESPERDRTTALIFAAVALVYLFLRESLVSHGAVYWPHSVSQLCLIAGAWACWRVFSGRAGPGVWASLMVVCLLYPMLEWTGYVFNAGVALALLAHGAAAEGQRLRLGLPGGLLRGLPLAIGLATLVAGLITLGHLLAATTPGEMFGALKSSAVSRTSRLQWLELLPGAYWLSFAMLLPLGALAIG